MAPRVGSQHFAYDEKGRKAAQEAARATGQKVVMPKPKPQAKAKKK